ncbi:MAG: endonuclease [Candidatus Izemoplasmatales bacterium]
MKLSKKLIIISLTALMSFAMLACQSNYTTTCNTTGANTSSSLTTTLTGEENSSTELNLDVESIEIVNNTKIFYNLNEDFDVTSLEIKANLSDGSNLIINNEELTIRGFDSSIAGEKLIYIIYDKKVLETNVFILEEYAFEIEMDYYQDAINLNGEVLRIALNTIISENFKPLLYADAIWVLEEADVDPENSNNVILVYPGEYGESVPTGYSSDISGYYWNREHVWPQSRLGVNVSYDNDFASVATDVHNIKPADEVQNSLRSNDYFDNISVSNSTYEPNENVKGDIARILFYMSTRYLDLTLNDEPSTVSGRKTMGLLSRLLEWNETDPVDDFERNRNEVIYKYQGNRNPFIDYPEFAELIWGDLSN